MNKTFKYNDSFVEYLESQRHRCRANRQKKDFYGLTELYLELNNLYEIINNELNINNNKELSILDIGCGLGYIDIIFYHNLKLKPHLYLFDAESTFEYNKGDSKKNKKFYNSLRLTRDFLLLNDVGADKVNLLNAEVSDELNKINTNSLDIIISLFSWFWHYPNLDYLKQSHRMISNEGHLIFNFKCRNAFEENDKVQVIKDSVSDFFVIKNYFMLDGEILFILKKKND